MHHYFSILLLYISFIYTLGGSLLLLLAWPVVRRNSIFINSSLALTVGGFATVLALYLLAVANRLDLVTLSTVLPIFLGTILLFAFLFERHVGRMKFDVKHLVAFLLIILFFYPFMRDALFSYLIAWDATAIWFLKAKVFFFADGMWNNAYYQEPQALAYSHKAYPVGFPLLVAAYYRMIGFVNDQTAQLLFALFYIHIPLAFYGLLRRVGGRTLHVTTLLLTLSLFAIPNFLIYAHNGYVDVQLSFTFLMTTILIILMGEEREARGKATYGVLALTAAALGATFKNEGIPFFVMTAIGTVGHLVLTLRGTKIDVKPYLLVMAIALMVTALPVDIWEYVKYSYGTVTDPYIANTQITTNVSRVKMIVFHYLDEFMKTAKYGLLLIPFLVLYFMQITMTVMVRRFSDLWYSAIIFAQLGVYTAIYFVTTVPLMWQLETSFERLLLHLLPSFFVLVVYYMKPFLAYLRKYLED